MQSCGAAGEEATTRRRARCAKRTCRSPPPLLLLRRLLLALPLLLLLLLEGLPARPVLARGLQLRRRGDGGLGREARGVRRDLAPVEADAPRQQREQVVHLLAVTRREPSAQRRWSGPGLAMPPSLQRTGCIPIAMQRRAVGTLLASGLPTARALVGAASPPAVLGSPSLDGASSRCAGCQERCLLGQCGRRHQPSASCAPSQVGGARRSRRERSPGVPPCCTTSHLKQQRIGALA